MRAALVASLLVLPMLVVPPAAAATVQAEWEYRLSIPDVGSGNVRVDLTLRGLQGSITKFVFLTAAHREPVTNVTCGADTPGCAKEDRIEFEVDGVERFSYDVRVERPAFVAGQVLGHAGEDFALFKAESVALEYRYSFFEGVTFQNRTTIVLDPPAGWSAKGPWNQTGDDTYQLPAGQVLPRGYVVMGPFKETVDRDVGGKRVHYVRLGDNGAFEDAMFDYIDKATPYYAAVYGPGVERDVLVVSAPDPMFKGGLGGANSFFVHEEADLRTLAHEYAHVFQQFGTQEAVGRSAIWLNEGDADLHSAQSLFAADVWSPQQVTDFFREAAKDQKDPQLVGARLPDAAYGGALERFSYHKGMLVLRALDVLMQERSGGEVGVADVLRELNRVHGDPSRPEAAQPVENEEIEDVAERLLGGTLDEFFARYVRGAEWPTPPAPFVPEGQLVVDSLVVTPERAPPGDPVVVVATLANRGTSDQTRDVDLLIDGKRVETKRVTLAVGQTTTIEYALAMPGPGDHEARVLYERATLHALTPPALGISRTSFVPATPRAGETTSLLVYVDNEGEQAGTVRVEARAATGALLAGSTETVVDGAGTAVVTLPITFTQTGDLTVALRLITPTETATLDVSVNVAQPDADGDGVPDPLDAYPANAALWEKSVGNDVKNAPGVALVGVLAAALVALAARGRRREDR